jgi:DNA ligase-1
MSSSNVMLAKKWEDQDPTGWWMSEKLDGVRALWDGKRFISRLGNVFPTPAHYLAQMPKGVVLDGELWMGRGAFQDTVSVVKSSADKGWSRVLYKVFDVPEAPGGFEQRMMAAWKLVRGPATVLEQTKCKGRDHLSENMRRIVSQKGEGIMLRRPGSEYETRRSSSLLKVKVFHDAEARVVGHQPGEGKHRGRLGALECVTPKGVAFKVGTGFTDAQREDPPRVGTMVTYSYQELTRDGVPRFPAFVAARDYE